MSRKRIPPHSKLDVELTAQDWTDLTEHTFVEREFVRCAVVERGVRRVHWSLADIEHVQGHVAATSNHTDDPKLERRIRKLSDKLQSLLDAYAGHNEA